MLDVDLDSYGEPNDIEPDDPAPRAPEGAPDRTTDAFEVWLFDAEGSQTVPDVYVSARDPNPLDFRMWVFVGRGRQAAFVMRASHKYGENELVHGGREDCCEVLFEGESLSETHLPESVRTLVEGLTDATVTTPSGADDDEPINY